MSATTALPLRDPRAHPSLVARFPAPAAHATLVYVAEPWARHWGKRMTIEDVSPTDVELLARASSDQASAFGVVYDRHSQRVLNTCYRILQQREDAEDAAALVFLEAWRHRARIRDVDGSIGPWLVTTSVNVARTYRRGRGRYQTFLHGLRPEEEYADTTAESDERLDRETGLGPTWQAFAKLSQKEQVVLMLCLVEEVPQEEAARTLGVAVGTVKSRLHRAKERLRKQIETDAALRARSEDGGRS